MGNSVKLFLIVLSVAMNVAFGGVWLARTARGRHVPATPHAESSQTTGVWCPLHRKLGVDQRQWQEIEPRLKEFQASAGELCGQIAQLRSEVLGLVASEEPDLAAIRAKQDEVLAIKRRVQQLVVRHLLAEKEVLTADQQKQLFEMLRNRAGCFNPPLSGQGSARDTGSALLDHDKG